MARISPCICKEPAIRSLSVVDRALSRPTVRSCARHGHQMELAPLVVVDRALPHRDESHGTSAWSRRAFLLGSFIGAALQLSPQEAVAADSVPIDIDVLASYAFQAYNEKDLQRAREYFSKIIARDNNPVWLERRGQVLVDMKEFEAALVDFNQAESLYRCAWPCTLHITLVFSVLLERLSICCILRWPFVVVSIGY